MGPWEKYGAQKLPDNLQNDPIAQEINGGPKPWEKFSPKKEVNKGEAALQGFGQAGTFGYLPNIQAAVEPVTDKVFGLLTGNKVEDPRSYVERRDAASRRDKELSKSGAYTAGQIAGSIATPVPGLGAGKLAKAATSGAISGALYNPGDTEGEVSGLQLGERLKGGLIGGGLGAAAQGVMSGTSKLAEKWANKSNSVKEVADLLTLDALGTKKKFAKDLIENDKIADVAEFARKENIISAGESFDDAFKKAQQIKQSSGKQIGDTYRKITEELSDPKVLQKADPEAILKYQSSEVEPAKLAQEFLSRESKELTGTSGAKQVIGKLQSELENLAEVPNDIESLLKYRRSLDKSIKNWAKESIGSEASLKRLRGFIKENIDNRIDSLDKIVGSNKTQALKELNKKFALSSDIESILQDKMESEIANRSLGLVPAMISTGGGLLGAGTAIAQGQDPMNIAENALLGASAGYAFKKGRDYLPAVGAKALGGAAKVLQKDPTASLARGAAGLIKKLPPEQMGLIDRVRREK